MKVAMVLPWLSFRPAKNLTFLVLDLVANRDLCGLTTAFPESTGLSFLIWFTTSSLLSGYFPVLIIYSRLIGPAPWLALHR